MSRQGLTRPQSDLPGVVWRKSTRSSGGGNGNCVEVTRLAGGVAMRDSKFSAGEDFPVLSMNRPNWDGFLAGIHTGLLTS